MEIPWLTRSRYPPCAPCADVLAFKPTEARSDAGKELTHRLPCAEGAFELPAGARQCRMEPTRRTVMAARFPDVRDHVTSAVGQASPEGRDPRHQLGRIETLSQGFRQGMIGRCLAHRHAAIHLRVADKPDRRLRAGHRQRGFRAAPEMPQHHARYDTNSGRNADDGRSRRRRQGIAEHMGHAGQSTFLITPRSRGIVIPATPLHVVLSDAALAAMDHAGTAGSAARGSPTLSGIRASPAIKSSS